MALYDGPPQGPQEGNFPRTEGPQSPGRFLLSFSSIELHFICQQLFGLLSDFKDNFLQMLIRYKCKKGRQPGVIPAALLVTGELSPGI